jgi:hypothetical protein
MAAALDKLGNAALRPFFDPAPALDAPEDQNGGICMLLARSADIARWSNFIPLTPSISE